MHDEEIIKAVREGKQEAFAHLLDKYMRKVRGFIALRAPVPHLIDELAHETFVYAYRHLDEFTRNDSFISWLVAIADNLLKAEIQRYSREEKQRNNYIEHCLFEQANKEMRPSGSVAATFDYLQKCLERLPDKLQELIQLRYQKSDNSENISKKLGRSLPWVRTTLFRVREKLKQCIEDKRSAGENS